MAATFQLELVAADRVVWSGEATFVVTRTLEGEIGILANHAPVLGVLAPGIVEIRPDDGRPMFAAVDGGFLSVAQNRISILAGHAELSDEIDLAEAQRALEEAQANADGSERSQHLVAAAQARITAVERAS
jgi:F-type H+-transporting ATPase subunit epsilon